MSLIAYVVADANGWSILPAPLERDWMDQSPNRFAYRCLPLVIANQAGWIIPCPVGFRARSTGKADYHNSVELVFDAQPDRWKGWISSHFGSGILTFSLPWLFRTPEPICLAARGLPNTWKHGAAPLEGIVETYWSPFTFTMNWKLTRVGEWVRFEKDEPICYLQPISTTAIEDLTPSIRPIASDEATKREFDLWNKARRELIQDPSRGASWQKNYFQGRDMSGNKPEVHKSKLTLRPFEPPTPTTFDAK